MKKLKDEYLAKVIDDNGLVRGRIPTPVLNRMGAKAGDSVGFHLKRSGEAIMRIVGAKAKRSGKKSRKSSRAKRR
jgi:hypothetical protein